MVTYKNLQDFIKTHKKDFDKDSLVVFLDKKSNTFQVIRSTGNLNIDTYSFYDESGERLFTHLLKRDGGVNSTGAIGMMGHGQVSFKLDDSVKVDHLDTLWNMAYNVNFDRTGFQTVYSNEIEDGRFSDDAQMVCVGFPKGYNLIEGIEILHQPKYIKNCSYGHDSKGQAKSNMLALVIGDHLEQKYEPSYESLVIEKFADFIKKDI